MQRAHGRASGSQPMGIEQFSGFTDTPSEREQRRQAFRRQRTATLVRHVLLFVAVCVGVGIGAAIGAVAVGLADQSHLAFARGAGWSLVGGLLGLIRGVYSATVGSVWRNLGETDNSDQGDTLYAWMIVVAVCSGVLGAEFGLRGTWPYAASGGAVVAVVAWFARRVVRRSQTGRGPVRRNGG
jgi:hypothetical protein